MDRVTAREALSDRILDHRLIRRDDEGGTFCEYEQPNCLQGLYRGPRKTPVKVVDRDDELIHARLVEQFPEGFAEPPDLFFHNPLRR